MDLGSTDNFTGFVEQSGTVARSRHGAADQKRVLDDGQRGRGDARNVQSARTVGHRAAAGSSLPLFPDDSHRQGDGQRSLVHWSSDERLRRSHSHQRRKRFQRIRRVGDQPRRSGH